MISFAYVHCKPTGVPFYVGKGALRRAKYLGERNQHHQNVVAKYGAENILVGLLECSTPEIAYDLEAGIIKCLRRSGVELCNLTAGGDGGRSPSEETRKRLSEAAKKRGVSEACHTARVIAKTGKALSEDQKKKQSETMKGIVFSKEHRRNISIGAKKRGILPNTRAKNIECIRKKVIGVHPVLGVKIWGSAKDVAVYLRTPISTTSKKIKAQLPYMGWSLEYLL